MPSLPTLIFSPEEKVYQVFINTNGKFLCVCEYLSGYGTGDDKSLELAMFNVEQVVDTHIVEEDLWKYCTQYKLEAFYELKAALNEDHLVVSHSSKKLSIHKLG